MKKIYTMLLNAITVVKKSLLKMLLACGYGEK